MTRRPADIQELAEDLTAVLDEEIGLEAAAAEHLRDLADTVLARDAGAMERLLAGAEETQTAFDAAEVRRREIAGQLASAVGTPGRPSKLAPLARAVGGPAGHAIDARRRRLVILANEVRRRHLRAAILLGESARLNRAVLRGLFPQLESAGTYESGGTSPRLPGGGLVDARS